MLFTRSKCQLPDAANALPGRSTPVLAPVDHYVNGNPLLGPYPENCDTAYFALGCYWGAERVFWPLEGVWVTAVGNIGGFTENPTYQEVCSGRTGHAEAVMVVFDPAVVRYENLLAAFWQAHDPTQGMRQGNDVGTQYRSGIYTVNKEQMAAALASRDRYQQQLSENGYGKITTEITTAGPFYFAEQYHQQYLAKNPQGYCGLGGTGVCFKR